MALESYGYDGTVNEQAWAQMAPQLGADQSLDVIPGGYDAVPGAGAYTIDIAPGVATAHGVMVKNTTTYTATCPAISSGTRWDTVAIYRDWRPAGGGTSRIDVLPGTSVPDYAPGLKNNPGVEHHQPIWLARLDAAKSKVELLDIRTWASPIYQAGTSLAIRNPVNGQLAGIAGVPSVYRAGSGWNQIGATLFYRDWLPSPIYGIVQGPIVTHQVKVPDPGFPYRLFCTGSVITQSIPSSGIVAEIVAGPEIVSRTLIRPDGGTDPMQHDPLNAGFTSRALTGAITVGVRVSAAATASTTKWSVMGGSYAPLNVMVVPA